MDEQFKLGPLHDLSTVNESGSLKFTCCMLVRVSFICLALGPRYCSLQLELDFCTEPVHFS